MVRGDNLPLEPSQRMVRGDNNLPLGPIGYQDISTIGVKLSQVTYLLRNDNQLY
jgi:hypothetical protein